MNYKVMEEIWDTRSICIAFLLLLSAVIIFSLLTQCCPKPAGRADTYIDGQA